MELMERALLFTLAEEGGYANNPNDRGGATNFGIIQRTLDAWNRDHPEYEWPKDVKDLTVTQASEIYRRNYWKWDGVLNELISIKLFDLGVNMGPARAVKILQAASNGVDGINTLAVDGILGPRTLSTVNKQSPSALMKSICVEQAKFYHEIVDKNPSQKVFLRGWLKRAARIPEEE